MYWHGGGLDDGGTVDPDFDIAELVVNGWQLRPHAHRANISESTAGATA
jgi:hypothetical protein